MLQNNIGTAYWNLAQQENPEENLLLAIGFYREALKYRTPTTAPDAYAATQNNIGMALWHIANLGQISREEQQKFLLLCISAFSEVIRITQSFSGISDNFDLLGTHNNLGSAHYQIVINQFLNGDKKNISHHLQSALKNHLQVLKQLDNQPEAYQATFNHILKTIRTFHDKLGIQGQNIALSQVPGELIPEILAKL
jgi:hypothetical protein